MYLVQLEWYLFFLKISKIATSDVVSMETRRNMKQEAHGPHRSPELTAVNMYM